MGAMEPSRWQLSQERWKMGATSLEKVGSLAAWASVTVNAATGTSKARIRIGDLLRSGPLNIMILKWFGVNARGRGESSFLWLLRRFCFCLRRCSVRDRVGLQIDHERVAYAGFPIGSVHGDELAANRSRRNRDAEKPERVVVEHFQRQRIAAGIGAGLRSWDGWFGFRLQAWQVVKS